MLPWIIHRPSRPLPDPTDIRASHRWLADHPQFPVPFAWARALARSWNRTRPVASLCCAAAFGALAARVGVASAEELERALIVGQWGPSTATTVNDLAAWGA